MCSTILVPLDGSTRAEAILKHVETLAQRFNSKVIFLQVIEANVQEAAMPPARPLPDADCAVCGARKSTIIWPAGRENFGRRHRGTPDGGAGARGGNHH
jgi:hypothetical protein